MASQQLPETRLVQKQDVTSLDFKYDQGQWNKPITANQAGQLVSATQVQANASVFVFANEPNNVKITFNLSKPSDCYGWEESDLAVRAKVGKNGTYQTQTIKDTYLAMPFNLTRAITVVFRFPADPLGTDNNLHFGLFDPSQNPKGGLALYGATVADVNSLLME